MKDLLLLSGSIMIVVALSILSRTTKKLEPSIRLSNAFVALASLLICCTSKIVRHSKQPVLVVK